MVSYQRAVELNEQDTLTYYTERANAKRSTDQALFVNLTLKQIIQNISQTFIDIINELVSGELTKERLIMVFFKEDRMVYIGSLLVIVAFVIYVTDII